MMVTGTLQLLSIFLWVFLLVSLRYDGFALPSVSSLSATGTPTRLARGVAKAAAKFEEFAKRENSVLVVDGNNVRGSTRFRWNPVEVQGRVRSFCHTIGISRAVVVWDHGIKRFAASPPPNESSNLDVVAIFSGLSQRADNVMVKESTHLARSFCDEDWSLLCFVTSDMGLQGRLISRAKADSPTMTNSMRPFVIDSTRFVELLEPCNDESYAFSIDKQSCRVYRAQKSFEQFAKLRKAKYNPSREKTWHRCVLGEELRRSYLRSHQDGTSIISFSSRYIKDLGERGYFTPLSDASEKPSAILGPSRLDKRQCGILKDYNQAMEQM